MQLFCCCWFIKIVVFSVLLFCFLFLHSVFPPPRIFLSFIFRLLFFSPHISCGNSEWHDTLFILSRIQNKKKEKRKSEHARFHNNIKLWIACSCTRTVHGVFPCAQFRFQWFGFSFVDSFVRFISICCCSAFTHNFSFLSFLFSLLLFRVRSSMKCFIKLHV